MLLLDANFSLLTFEVQDFQRLFSRLIGSDPSNSLSIALVFQLLIIWAKFCSFPALLTAKFWHSMIMTFLSKFINTFGTSTYELQVILLLMNDNFQLYRNTLKALTQWNL